MKAIRAAGYDDLSRKAAVVIAAHIIENPRCVLGLAAGATPEGVYDELAAMHKDGLLDFSRVTTFNLDEFYPILPGAPGSFRAYMRERLFSRVNINPDNTHFPEDETYDELIERAGGIDLQLLGLGRNGHIGFCEPGAYFSDKTGVIALAPSTVETNAKHFPSLEETPKMAVTMGVATILRARSVLLIAGGEEKQHALRRLFTGPIEPDLPASALRLHPRATVIYY